MDSIELAIEEGETARFFVLEETTVGGISYYLVSEQESGDGEALILKDLSAKDEEEAVFEFVEDAAELKAVADIFQELLEDTELV